MSTPIQLGRHGKPDMAALNKLSTDDLEYLYGELDDHIENLMMDRQDIGALLSWRRAHQQATLAVHVLESAFDETDPIDPALAEALATYPQES